jgi:hypothetical protein
MFAVSNGERLTAVMTCPDTRKNEFANETDI